MILFASKVNDELAIYLALSKEVLPFSKTNAVQRGATLINNRVQFRFLGLDLDDNYSGLGAVATIVDTYLRRGFENHQATIETIAYTGTESIKIFGTKISKENRKPFLKISTDSSENAVMMTPVRATQFHGALRKAMNWVAPESLIPG